MRFTSLTISNYRPYEAYKLDFNKTKDTDLHAVIASNGVGKTALLNAIEWCLYGDEPHLGDHNTLPICNIEALKKAREEGKTYENTSVVIEAVEGSDSLKIERTVSVKTTPPFFTENSKLRVYKQDRSKGTEILEGEEASVAINSYLPREIREYFFFDSEQLTDYFGNKDTNLNVKNSIHGVAQISIVSNTKDHLNKIIKDIREDIGKINPEINKISEAILQKEKARDQLKEENETLSEQAEKAAVVIKELNDKLNGSENAVEIRKRYDKNLTKLDILLQKEREANDELLTLVKKYYAPMMLYENNKATYCYIVEKKESGKLPPDVDDALVRKSLNEHKCAICGQDISVDSETHLLEILDRLQISSKASNALMEIKNDLNRLVSIVDLYDGEKRDVFKTLKEINRERSEIEEENKDLQTHLQSNESLTQIAVWMSDRDRQKQLESVNREKIGANKSQIEIIENDLVSLNERLRKANRDSQTHKDLSRELDFATDALKVVEAIESSIITDVRDSMGRTTMELFESLIWKKNTYDRISLTDSYQLELFSKESDISCLGSCSAAERQLLALAFTIALHKVSGHDALLFIDTPVGRVSDKNRENFAKTLVEVSKTKQIIMSFTPSEYSEEVSSYFDSALSSKRTLTLQNEKTVQ